MPDVNYPEIPEENDPENQESSQQESKQESNDEPAEEELSMSGPDPVKSTSATVVPDNDGKGHNEIKSSIADLESLVDPGASSEEFLEELLRIPQDQLIPWENCELPSKGFYYDWPDGLVKVKAMGQTAEKILATQRLAQSGQSIDYLFRECCVFPENFDPVELILGDRIFLLYYIRGITHGNMYEFAVQCPTCESTSTHAYDLNLLAGTITWADPAAGDEPFKIVLPYLSEATGRDVWVSVRLLRAKDANSMLSKQRTKKKSFARPGAAKSLNPSAQRNQSNELDDAITDNLEKIIVNVMGVDNPFTIRSFIDKLHATDTSTIREWLRNHTPGIDTTVTLGCPDCEGEFTVELPISESFFRPSNTR
tara:strand:- start:5070 stop:6170 length:1101 start_codon:yes stop_codon:yes gene_type:complete